MVDSLPGSSSCKGLIREALSQNYDVTHSPLRVSLQDEQAVLGITRADQFPTINGGGVRRATSVCQATRIGTCFRNETLPR